MSGFHLAYQLGLYAGGWVLDTESALKKFLYNLVRGVLMSSLLYFVVCILVQVHLETEVDNFAIGIIIAEFFSLILIKTTMKIRKRKSILVIQDYLDSNFGLSYIGSSSDRTILLTKSRRFHKIGIAFVYYSLFNNVVWFSLPFVLGTDRELLPIPAQFPYDHTQPVYYELTVLFQCLMSAYAVTLFHSNDLLFIGLLMQIHSQYEILEKNLLKLSPKSEGSEGFVSLRNILRHHQAIISATKHLDRVFNHSVLCDFIGLTLSLCGFGFYVLMAGGIKALIIATSIVFIMGYLFVYCVMASHLMKKSRDVAFAAYSHPWYAEDSSTRTLLHFMILRAQSPPQITIGKFFPISAPTFTQVVTTAYNLIAVLRQTTLRHFKVESEQSYE